jgi:hypothetical protein
MATDPLLDADLTVLLGPKCPSCGWRGGQHRPHAEAFAACPRTGRG